MIGSLALARPASLFLTPMSYEGMGLQQRAVSVGAPASAAWGTNNLIQYWPVTVESPFVSVKAFWYNGATLGASVLLGIYDLNWVKFAGNFTAAQSGANVVQEVAAAFTLPPGQWYLACQLTVSTGTLFTQTTVAAIGAAYGAAQETISGLPATATPILYAQTLVPVFGFSQRSLVA